MTFVLGGDDSSSGVHLCDSSAALACEIMRAMFARRLTLALAALAGAAVLEGLAAVWALSVANEHVLRGRVASDIQLAFKDLTVTKLRLRGWFTQAQLDPDAARHPWLRYQADLQLALDQLRSLSARAVVLDQSEATRAEHLQRQDALAVLAESIAGLEAAAAQVQALPPGTQARQAWLAAGQLFDISRGRDLQRLLADSIERESVAVARERAAADKALRWMRGLWLGAAAAIALAALLLAAGFARALRRPLDALNQGARALQRGNLAHRIPLKGTDEFAAVARSMNAMAVALTDHQAREIQARQLLEAQVTARTAELQSALEALQQVDARRRRLFADISHELRTPTTAILGEAGITLRGGDRPAADYQSALQRIAATCRQLGAVIDDLLTMARSDIDALALNRHAMDMTEPLRQAVEQARALAHERGVTVRAAELAPGTLRVLADPQRLCQILLLLLDNAVRYSRSGGAVEVAVQRRVGAADGAGHCEVCIVDQGIGITEEDLPHVFERNFRGIAARQHRADGSGLGLAIGRALAKAHGGDIVLDSRQGQGTTVRLWLPLLADTPLRGDA